MGGGFSRLGNMSESKMKTVFVEYDKDKSGKVSPSELLVMMEELNLGKADPEDNVAFLTEYLIESEADVDGDGELDFEEFKVFCKAAKKLQSAERKKLGNLSESAMLNVFMSADADSNGTISHTELIGLMEKLKIGPPEKSLQTAYITRFLEDSEVDVNGDGKFNFDEFMKMCRMAKVEHVDKCQTAKAAKKKKKVKKAAVVPSDAKKGGPAGQSAGYSDEAKKFLADKKAAKAKEISEIARQNAKRARELKKSVAVKQKAAGKKAKKLSSNTDYEKESAKLAAQSGKDRRQSQKSAAKHEKEFVKKAAALDASVHDVEAKVNTDYEKESARLAAQSEEDRKKSQKSAAKHEKEFVKKAAALDASVHENTT